MTSNITRNSKLSRRSALVGGASVAAASIALSPYGAFAAGPERPSLEKARTEGTLVMWHADPEVEKVAFYKAFTERTGIKVIGQRVAPGVALPKLLAQLRSGGAEIDVYDSSDEGLSDGLGRDGHLLRYEPVDIAMYEPPFRSNDAGLWTAYWINLNALAYSPKFVAPDQAPKTWNDLLNPAWRGSVGFQNTAAGSQYVWWYNVRSVVSADYWDKLREQKPRTYASSNQILADLLNGNLKIGGKVSAFQYVQAKRKGIELNMVFPPEGTPTGSLATSIVVSTKRPNAAKTYIDFVLSKEGQELWCGLVGCHSARRDVNVPDVPTLSKQKILVPSDFQDYASRKRHAEYVTAWNKISGF